jgi:hypothetical protein
MIIASAAFCAASVIRLQRDQRVRPLERIQVHARDVFELESTKCGAGGTMLADELRHAQGDYGRISG